MPALRFAAEERRLFIGLHPFASNHPAIRESMEVAPTIGMCG